jgi:hypothetical protein
MKLKRTQHLTPTGSRACSNIWSRTLAASQGAPASQMIGLVRVACCARFIIFVVDKYSFSKRLSIIDSKLCKGNFIENYINRELTIF